MTEFLGEVVSWDMNSVIIDHAKIRDSLSQSGLDPDACPDLSTKSAFSRACKDLRKERSIDRLEDDGGMISFQFTRKALEAGRFEFDYECVVDVETDTGHVTCQERPELAKEAKELLAHAMQTRTSRDISLMVQKLFRSHADLFPINKKGVAYLVPDRHRDFTNKVDQFLSMVGGKLTRLPIPKGTPTGNEAFKSSINEGLSSLIDELRETVDGWEEGTRSSTIERAQEKWDTIKYKVEAYAGYLETKQDALMDELNKAREQMIDKVTQLAESTSAAA